MCVLILGTLGVAAGEQWTSSGGIVPYAYDPANEGLGATVWIMNEYSDSIPINGMTLVLQDNDWNTLGTITLTGEKTDALMSGQDMSINVGIIPGARNVQTIIVRYNNVNGDELSRDWDIQGNIEHDLASLPYDQYILRYWVLKQNEEDKQDVYLFDNYTISS